MSGGLEFINSYTYEGFRYFSNVDFNGLFRQNIVDGKVEFIDYFPNEILMKRFIHRSVIGNNKKMYFFPLFGKGITEYDLDRKKFRFLELNGKYNIWGISGAFFYYEKVILIPCNLAEYLLIFNTNTFEVQYISIFKEEFKHYGIDKIDVDLFGSILYKDYIYIALCETNLIVEINLNSYKIKVHSMEAGIHFRNINIIDGDLWGTTTDNGIVLKIDLDFWNVNKIQLIDLINFHRAILTIEKWNDQIIAIPGKGYQLFKFEGDIFKPLNRNIPENMLGDVVGYMIDDNLNLYFQKGDGVEGEMNSGSTVVPRDARRKVYKNRLEFEGYELVKRGIRNRCMKDEVDKMGFLLECSNGIYTLNNYLEWIKE